MLSRAKPGGKSADTRRSMAKYYRNQVTLVTLVTLHFSSSTRRQQG